MSCAYKSTLSAIKCVILDRDGTLIEHVPYLCRPAQVRVLDSVVDGLCALAMGGCRLFLHTNQSGIGRGYFSPADADACNDEMLRQIGLGPSLFEDICVCPEGPVDDVQYRKPSPRYGLHVAARYNVAVSEICYIGDNLSDLLTARNAGCVGVGVNTGLHNLNEQLHGAGLDGAYPVFSKFGDAAAHVLRMQTSCA